MSLYNLLHGQNALADVFLGWLNLTRNDVGRFRDTYIERHDGTLRIAVYTRNGGGNRSCWCENDPTWGMPECKHHIVQEEAPVFAFMPRSEWPDGKPPGNLFTTRNGVHGCEYATGEKHMENRYVCEEPDSIACACPGCTIQYRLRAHPQYITDCDDDFDCTYATVWFRVPDVWQKAAAALVSDEPTPAEKWDTLLATLKESPDDPASQAAFEKVRPLIEGIVALLNKEPT